MLGFILFFVPAIEVLGDSLVGDYVGILYRENASLIAGQGEVIGQVPFKLSITSDSPLKGEINNQPNPSEPQKEGSHYSLYFPKGLYPVTFENSVSDNLKFKKNSKPIHPVWVLF